MIQCVIGILEVIFFLVMIAVGLLLLRSIRRSDREFRENQQRFEDSMEKWKSEIQSTRQRTNSILSIAEDIEQHRSN